MIVIAYLAAITAANLIISVYGPAMSVVTAFVLIGFDLVARDALHERWRGAWLWPRMLALIAAGGALSYALNAGAGRIAVASCVAFVLAGVVDAVAYQALRARGWFVRANGSNIPSALVDSVVFPALAFGGFLWPVMLGQFVAKVGGGLVWSVLLRRWRKEAA